MVTKAQRVRNLLAAGRTGEALRLVAKFPRLPEPERTDIKRAVAALLSPELYTAMNYDLAVVHQRGLDAVRRLFGGQ